MKEGIIRILLKFGSEERNKYIITRVWRDYVCNGKKKSDRKRFKTVYKAYNNEIGI
jgi:hypothetical protein